MSEFKIKNIEGLVKPILSEKKKYIESKISKLTSAGDNYGSLMLGVQITIEDDQGNRENVNVVAKLLPQNEFIQKMFNSQYTFRNEIEFYKTIAPTLQEFQKGQGFDEVFNSFPAYIGARLNMDPTKSEVDEDAVLLVKNIKDEGYVNIDRTAGFNLEQTQLILEKMAELHGTFMALKLLKPEVFEKKLQHFFQEYTIFDVDEEVQNKFLINLSGILKDDEFCVRHIDRIQEILRNSATSLNHMNKTELQEGPFQSIVHGDMWSNNIMVKIVDNKTVDVKFIDFQMYVYSSLTRDVIFFLFASVQFSTIQQHCDMLLKFYYDCLINCLKKLKCNTSTFTFHSFIDDVKNVSQSTEFYHILLMLAPIYAGEDNTREIEDLDANEMMAQRSTVSDMCRQKCYFVVKEFFRRNWI